MWRLAAPSDDAAIVDMCTQLNAEDPGPEPVPPAHMQRTLAKLRNEPMRGRAVVLELDGKARGYALLIAYWSNELGGETCTLDEIFVAAEARGRGHTTRLVGGLADGSLPWAKGAVALELEVTPSNQRARSLYERLEFRPHNLGMYRRIDAR